MKTIQLSSKIKKHRVRSNYRIGRAGKMYNVKQIRTRERVIRFRDITKAKAKQEIENYIHEHPEGSLTSKIIETLRIDPLLTSNILEEMKQEGLTFSKPVE